MGAVCNNYLIPEHFCGRIFFPEMTFKDMKSLHADIENISTAVDRNRCYKR